MSEPLDALDAFERDESIKRLSTALVAAFEHSWLYGFEYATVLAPAFVIAGAAASGTDFPAEHDVEMLAHLSAVASDYASVEPDAIDERVVELRPLVMRDPRSATKHATDVRKGPITLCGLAMTDAWEGYVVWPVDDVTCAACRSACGLD